MNTIEMGVPLIYKMRHRSNIPNEDVLSFLKIVLIVENSAGTDEMPR